MQNIALAKKIEFKPGKDENEGSIIVEPLYPGYGMTLGNSLRRVLLSSLPGAAVVGVKIKGISHEFMAMPNVKEDVLEIILNLKQLRLKVHTEEEVKLEIHVKGAKKITAADIVKNSDVEISNPELFLAETTTATATLDLEIYINEGRGYRMVEGNKKDGRDIGYIEIDSIFSPVLIVSIDVENTRVGKMTNWDKLVLNLKTDGTITPMEAFEESVKILVDQYSILLPGAMEIAKESQVSEDVAIDEPVEVEEEVEEEKPAKKAKKVK
ncbi:MAG: DNA-directed RNA polymerase subunit alpha [Patescibacteria group bacterium]